MLLFLGVKIFHHIFLVIVSAESFCVSPETVQVAN